MVSKAKNFVSAVIYVHNAEARIGGFLRTVMTVLEENFEYAEIICVNDHSEDNSVQVVREISETAGSINVTV